MKTILHATLLGLLVGACQTTESSQDNRDIAINRQLPIESTTANRSGAPIVLSSTQRIDWQKFFQKAPTVKEREALLREVRVADDKQSPQDLLVKGRKYMALGQLVNAEANLKLALRKDVHNPEILLSLAEVSLRKNKTQEAFDYLVLTKEEIDALAKKDVNLVFRYRYILALTYLESKDKNSAHAILTDLIRIDKTFTPAYVALSQSYLAQSKNHMAIFVAKRGIDRGNDSAALQNILGVALRQNGELTSAKTHFQRALALDAQHVPSLVNFSGLLIDMGDKEPAELMLKRAVALAPGDFTTYLSLAQCQKQLGQVASARQSYERALTLNPESAQARFHLAQLFHEQLGERSQALRLFGEVVQLNDQRYVKLSEAYINDIMAKGL